MKLTGKCREDFDKWMSTDFDLDENPITINASYEGDMEVYVSDNFDILPKSMQYGVYVDFFDSVGIEINLIKSRNINYYQIDDIAYTYSYSLKTRPEARIKAIEKANEIYNK
jgi:hypothetical protein